MQSRPSTPENADRDDKIKAKEEPSNLEKERSNLEKERPNLEKEISNLEEEKCLQTASKNTLISSPVVSPMRENISSLRFGNLLHLIQLTISENSGQQDDMSGTFEDYLEKSNMLCSQEGVDHYFLPNSQKSDFV